MNRIHQDKFGVGGNCMAACVATLLGLTLGEVPNFCGDHSEETWYDHFAIWLRGRGYAPICLLESFDEETERHLSHAPCIVVGPAARGLPHCVIMRGTELVHDPHPGGRGVTAILSRTFLIPLISALDKPKETP